MVHKSSQANLISQFEITVLVAKGNFVDKIYLDFGKVCLVSSYIQMKNMDRIQYQ